MTFTTHMTEASRQHPRPKPIGWRLRDEKRKDYELFVRDAELQWDYTWTLDTYMDVLCATREYGSTTRAGRDNATHSRTKKRIRDEANKCHDDNHRAHIRQDLLMQRHTNDALRPCAAELETGRMGQGSPTRRKTTQGLTTLRRDEGTHHKVQRRRRR